MRTIGVVAVLLVVLAGVAVEAHPLAAIGGESLVAAPEILEIVGIDHRRRRVDLFPFSYPMLW